MTYFPIVTRVTSIRPWQPFSFSSLPSSKWSSPWRMPMLGQARAQHAPRATSIHTGKLDTRHVDTCRRARHAPRRNTPASSTPATELDSRHVRRQPLPLPPQPRATTFPGACLSPPTRDVSHNFAFPKVRGRGA